MQKPVSGLWKVTRSTNPDSGSRVISTCDWRSMDPPTGTLLPQ